MPTWLVAGLGNPGSKYERTRHNIGFRVVDALAAKHGLSWKSGGKLGGDSASGLVGRERVVLLKPMEFMNLSGFAVQRAAAFHTVELDHVLAVHDEIDLELGIVRLKSGGGHGGHNGLRSICEQLGDNGFARLRMGVGRDPNARPGAKDAAGWVLSEFPPALAPLLGSILAAGCEDVESVVSVGIKAAMNQHNARPAVV